MGAGGGEEGKGDTTETTDAAIAALIIGCVILVIICIICIRCIIRKIASDRGEGKEDFDPIPESGSKIKDTNLDVETLRKIGPGPEDPERASPDPRPE